MYTLAVILSLGVGAALGLLGGGGAILTVAILVYALGVDAEQAVATSLVVVAVTSTAALVPHVRAGNVEWGTGLGFGVAGMAGAFAGGLLAARFSARALMVLFALMMVATAIAMLRAPQTDVPHRSPLGKRMLAGLGVGFVTSLVGGGGGFLVVPALVLVGGLPIRRAIGTSLLVIAMNTSSGVLGRVTHLDVALTAVVSASAVVGAWVGGALSGRADPTALRKGFAWFVLVLGVFQLSVAFG